MDLVSREDEDQLDGTAEVDRSTWDCLANWTQAERDYWFMGPFDGGVPGMVRRIRRILDVSQRGLAAILEVSQSAVARWETGRTSPRASVVERMLRLARLRVTVHDKDGSEVGPMRADGARTYGGSRFPAHVDLPGHDRAGVEEDAGQVEPRGGHEHPGQRLVAPGEEHRTVETLGHHHGLDRVSDDLAADEREVHALVAHRDAVGDRDGAELEGEATARVHAVLHGLG